jgi:hypothetical protein
MASIFTPARPTTISRSTSNKTHKSSKSAINFANRYQQNIDLFTKPKTTSTSDSDACFSVEFAMMSFEEQLIKCQMGEGDLSDLREQFGSVRQVVGRSLSKV